VGKHEGKRQLGRPRYSWEDNIKMDLSEVVCGGMASYRFSPYLTENIVFQLIILVG